MKKQNKEQSKLGNLVIVLVLIVIFFSAIGYFMMSKIVPKTEKETSNGFVFVKQKGFWYTQIYNPIERQEITLDFRYSPSQVRNITVEGNPRDFLTTLQKNNLTGAYITFNFTSNVSAATTLAAADLSKMLKVINGITLVAACTDNISSACIERPIVTCKNQEDRAMVINIKNSDIPKITMKKNCLTIEGNDKELVRAYNKLLFIIYGII